MYIYIYYTSIFRILNGWPLFHIRSWYDQPKICGTQNWWKQSSQQKTWEIDGNRGNYPYIYILYFLIVMPPLWVSYFSANINKINNGGTTTITSYTMCWPLHRWNYVVPMIYYSHMCILCYVEMTSDFPNFTDGCLIECLIAAFWESVSTKQWKQCRKNWVWLHRKCEAKSHACASWLRGLSIAPVEKCAVPIYGEFVSLTEYMLPVWNNLIPIV